jgi:hypothetical protein
MSLMAQLEYHIIALYISCQLNLALVLLAGILGLVAIISTF